MPGLMSMRRITRPTLIASVVIDTGEESAPAIYRGGVCSVIEGQVVQELPCDYHYIRSYGTKHFYRSDYIVPCKNRIDAPIYKDSKGIKNIILYCPINSVIQLQGGNETLLDLAKDWFQQNSPIDINNDGIVNLQDYAILTN